MVRRISLFGWCRLSCLIFCLTRVLRYCSCVGRVCAVCVFVLCLRVS